MDVFTSPYYVRCNSFLRLSGLWPYQSSAVQICKQILVFLLVLTIYLPLCADVYIFRNDFEYLAQAVPLIFDYMIFFSKNVFFLMKRKKIKRVLDSVRQDFQIHTEEELEVLHKYSKTACTFNNLYTACVFITSISLTTFPFTLFIMDMFMPLNETRLQGQLRISGYHIGKFANNNLFIIIHLFISDIVITILVVGIDTLYMSLTYHVCALFIIITKRIRNAIDNNIKLMNNGLEKKQDLFHVDFIRTVVMHQYALKFRKQYLYFNRFGQMMELTFSSLNLIAIGCIVITLAFVGFQALLNKDNPGELVTYFLYTLCEILLLFYYNWPGEVIKEHSLLIHRTCYDTNWYEKEFPVECKKMMNYMIVRSQKPSIMTAGKFYELGLENFAAVVKVSMSYLTVLSSIT